LLRVVLGDPERFEFLGKEQITKSCRVVLKAVTVADFGSLLGGVDLVNPVASVVAAVSFAGSVAVHVASASAVAATTSSSAAAVGGTAAIVVPVVGATAPTTMAIM
jgi:hypothetical protein